MNKLKKIGIITLGTLSLLGTVTFAATGIVNAPSGLVLREEAKSGSNPITTLPDDAKVEIIEEDGEWYKVTYNSKTGYAYAKYVETEDEVEPASSAKNNEEENAEQTEESQATGTAKSKLKVYNIPLITSTVINEIEPDSEIKIEKQITNWAYVVSGDIQGWVRSYGLNNKIIEPTEETEVPEEKPEQEVTKPEDEEKPEESKPEQKPEEKPEEPVNNEKKPADNSGAQETAIESTKGYVNVDAARVRKEASTSSEEVTTLTYGTSFTINAETEDWYKITYKASNGDVYEGYIRKDLVIK